MSKSTITKEIIISNELRTKVANKDYTLSDELRTELEAVYYMITSIVGKARRIPKCPGTGCLEMPFKIMTNYVTYHEPQSAKTRTAHRTTEVSKVSEGDKLDKFNLKQLRKMYPEVKATSKRDFIAKVNQLKK